MPSVAPIPREVIPMPGPGANPLRVALIGILNSMMTDPSQAMDLAGPLGMTRALRGKRVYHGTRSPYKVVRRSARKYDVQEKPVPFKHFVEKLQGHGAGGNMYGKGIYLTEHPKIAEGYAGGVSRGVRGSPTVRTQNLPPQTSILSIDTPLSPQEFNRMVEKVGMWETRDGYPLYEKAAQVRGKLSRFPEYGGANPSLEHILEHSGFSMRHDLPKVVREMGYDGISFSAGRVGTLPRGVPEGTRNYVIYNYDVINQPKKLLK